MKYFLQDNKSLHNPVNEWRKSMTLTIKEKYINPYQRNKIIINF